MIVKSPHLLLLTLLAMASCRSSAPSVAFNNPSHEPRTFGASGRPLSYLVLGDSTAAGEGADYESGIAVMTARHLAASHVVTMRNFGVSGDRAIDIVKGQLPLIKGLKPDVVLISVGANDVTRLSSVGSMEENTTMVVERLRELNPDVRIVITGSPDVGSAPRVPFLLRPIAKLRTRQANSMFVELASRKGLEFAPIARETGPLFHRDHTLFAADHYHPNERGYATWLPPLDAALDRALAAPAR